MSWDTNHHHHHSHHNQPEVVHMDLAALLHSQVLRARARLIRFISKYQDHHHRDNQYKDFHHHDDHHYDQVNHPNYHHHSQVLGSQ